VLISFIIIMIHRQLKHCYWGIQRETYVDREKLLGLKIVFRKLRIHIIIHTHGENVRKSCSLKLIA